MAPSVDVRLHRALVAPFVAVALSTLLPLAGCALEPLGDNFVQPEVMVDEDFFFCRVQPEVIAPQTCASGASGESGSCHSARSAMRLDVLGETDMPPDCDEDGVVVGGAVPQSYMNNLEAVRRGVRPDPLSSPLYQRPIGQASHPRVIFDASSPEADLIVEWMLR